MLVYKFIILLGGDNISKRGSLIYITTNTLILVIVLVFFCILNYIDFEVIKRIYFPIWCISIFPMLFGRVTYGSVFLTSANIGLIMEYIMNLLQRRPNMGAAFLDTLILFIGFTLGIVLEIFSWKNKSRISNK